MTRRRGGRGPRGQAGAGPPEAGADARRLHELALIARDRSRWDALDEDTLLLLVFQQCLYWAHTRDSEAAVALAELYPHVAARVDATARLELLERVTESVESGGTPVLALLPFLQHEPDAPTVALAAGAFATLAPAEGGDPLAGPRALLRMAEHAEEDGTRAGLVAGLLELGDRRTLPLAREGWTALPGTARVRLAELRPASTVAFASVVEFWLEALEDAEGDVARAAAGALARMAERADPRRVLDVRRKLPANAPDERDEIEIVADEPIDAVAERLAPRLRDLARRGSPVEAALAAWGIAR